MMQLVVADKLISGHNNDINVATYQLGDSSISRSGLAQHIGRGGNFVYYTASVNRGVARHRRSIFVTIPLVFSRVSIFCP